MEKIQFEPFIIKTKLFTIQPFPIKLFTPFLNFLLFFWAIKSIENAERLGTPLEKVQY